MIYLLRRLFLSNLANTIISSPSNIKDYINNGAYSINTSATNRKLELIYSDSRPFESYAHEINRFSSAMYESANASKNSENNNTLGWSIIQMYYSAFFASHSILRSLGKSFTYLDSPSIARLNTLNKLYTGIASSLPDGIYFTELKHGTIDLTASNSKDGHKVLWIRISKEISEIQDFLIGNIPPTTDRDRLYDYLGEMSSILNSDLGILTRFRNEVNYTQSHNLWLPNKLKRKSSNMLSLELNSICKPPSVPSGSTEDIKKFLFLTRALVNLNHLIISEIDRSSSIKSSFINRGALKVMRTLKISP